MRCLETLLDIHKELIHYMHDAFGEDIVIIPHGSFTRQDLSRRIADLPLDTIMDRKPDYMLVAKDYAAFYHNWQNDIVRLAAEAYLSGQPDRAAVLMKKAQSKKILLCINTGGVHYLTCRTRQEFALRPSDHDNIVTHIEFKAAVVSLDDFLRFTNPSHSSIYLQGRLSKIVDTGALSGPDDMVDIVRKRIEVVQHRFVQMALRTFTGPFTLKEFVAKYLELSYKGELYRLWTIDHNKIGKMMSETAYHHGTQRPYWHMVADSVLQKLNFALPPYGSFIINDRGGYDIIYAEPQRHDPVSDLQKFALYNAKGVIQLLRNWGSQWFGGTQAAIPYLKRKFFKMLS